MTNKSAWMVVASFLTLLPWLPGQANAQVVIQLPTVRTFNVQTTVMVPDGGQMLLGGVNRGSYGSVERGVPGLSNLPGANRLFKNRGIGKEISSGTASVTAEIIILSEYEDRVLAEAERRAKIRISENANLDPKTVNRAKFLSRNVGKSKKHR